MEVEQNKSRRHDRNERGKQDGKDRAMSRNKNNVPWWKKKEVHCKNPERDKKGRCVGFGSCYQCKPFNYSKEEFLAEQGHPDHICTADCTPAGRAECKETDKDSRLDPDWEDCTLFDPSSYRLQKQQENELCEQCKRKRAYKNEHSRKLHPHFFKMCLVPSTYLFFTLQRIDQ